MTIKAASTKKPTGPAIANSARPTSATTGRTEGGDRPLAALACMTVSALAFSAMAVYVKRLVPAIPQFELVFFRSAVNVLWVLGLVLARKEVLWPASGKPLLIFRGLVGFAGVACMFYSLGHLPLPISSMLTWSSPVFVILLSRLFLGERMPSLSGVFIPLAFVGLVMLLDPTGSQAGPVSLKVAGIGLLAAIFGGMAYVAVRAATAQTGVNVIVFFFVAVSTLISAPLAALDYVKPTSSQWLELIALGSFATLGQLTMTRAYRYAPAGVVSMMNLLNPVFGAAIGLYLFHEMLGPLQWLGMTLVGVSLICLTLRSTVQRSALSTLRE